MKVLNETEKKVVVNNFFKRKNEIEKIEKNMKKCLFRSLVVISGITIGMTTLFGPIGLLSLLSFTFPLVKIDYYDRLSREIYHVCSDGKMTRREFKKSIKKGELKKYYDEMQQSIKKEKEFTEIFKMETPKVYEKYTPIKDDCSYQNERQK